MHTLLRGNLITQPVEWAERAFRRARDYRAFQVATIGFGILNCWAVWIFARRVPIPTLDLTAVFGSIFLLTSGLPLGYLHTIRALVLERPRPPAGENTE